MITDSDRQRLAAGRIFDAWTRKVVEGAWAKRLTDDSRKLLLAWAIHGLILPETVQRGNLVVETSACTSCGLGAEAGEAAIVRLRRAGLIKKLRRKPGRTPCHEFRILKFVPGPRNI